MIFSIIVVVAFILLVNLPDQLKIIFTKKLAVKSRKARRYVAKPYHCIPVLDRSQTKEQLKEALQGEYFELVSFQDKLLRQYVPVLVSKNWAVIGGTLISRKSIQQIYFLHDIPGIRNAQIKVKYFSGER